MDSDIEFSDDDDDTFEYGYKNKDLSPFPIEYTNETTSIESLYKCFMDRYNACPVFFTGTLQEACDAACSSSIIEEHRPVLVYIHDDKILSKNIFCSSVFCSEIMIEYLLENYIVWPWDVTIDSNRDILMQIWKDLFGRELSIRQCPMLIGIMLAVDIPRRPSLKSPYEYTLLLENDQLVRPNIELTRERLLNELINFKQQSEKNEKNLLYDFSSITGLPWGIILEISKYLTLNDAVTVFTPQILPLFSKFKTKLHLLPSSKIFIDIILKTIEPKQIVSLQVNQYQISAIEPSIIQLVRHISSLILFSIKDLDDFNYHQKVFSKLTSISLYYDYEVDFGTLYRVITNTRSNIKRLNIHCVMSLSCRHYFDPNFNFRIIPNVTIESFRLDVRSIPLESTDSCFTNDPSCLLLDIITLILIMKNIRYIHIITNKYNCKQFLDVNQWNRLIDESHQLKKVKLQFMEMDTQDEELIQKINELRSIEKRIKFQLLMI